MSFRNSNNQIAIPSKTCLLIVRITGFYAIVDFCLPIYML